MSTNTWMWTSRDQSAPVWPGSHQQLGATWGPEATNFAVASSAATKMWVCLFDQSGLETRHRLTEHTLGVWHGAIPGVEPGQAYGFRADGPWQPARGLRFNPAKLLLDPYAKAISGTVSGGDAVFSYHPEAPDQRSEQDSAPAVSRSIVVADDYDWGNDRPLLTRWRDTVIYEAHVVGLTALHDRIPEHLRGTYAGLAHPAVVDYLKDLGVTAIELLPCQQSISEPFLAPKGLENYWGYNTIGFFAPHGAYAAAGDTGGQVSEFKDMVRAFHAAGLEVYLDVVYNHTAEAGSDGPTYCFRGLDDANFYRRVHHRGAHSAGAHAAHDTDAGVGNAPGDAADQYWDVTGCGNTVNTDDPTALRLILDSLRYWVTDMHVDGFRFDLASALSRTGHEIDMRSAFMTTISQDPVLRSVKLIAEPWDTSGEGYQVGSFPPPWCEWNDRYRDTARDFWRGNTAGVRELASRMAGSSDLYADDGRSPYASVNFVTAHDGFTLRDLVSYNHKHNEANGEDNRDGTDNNRSDNHGVEGETDDSEIIEVRQRQAANLMATLAFSSGVPMLTAGDERGRTQLGNNNAYCHNNEISWIDWSADNAWMGLHDITKAALRLRREHPALRQRHHFAGNPTIEGGAKDLAWLHPQGREMTEADWHDDGLRTLGMFVAGDPLRAPGPHGEQQHDKSFVLWVHASPAPTTVQLLDNAWVTHGEVVLSTDPALEVGTPAEAGGTLQLGPRSVVLLRQS